MHPPFEEAIDTTKGPRSHAVGHPQPNQLGAHDRLRHPIPATPGLIETNDFFFPEFLGKNSYILLLNVSEFFFQPASLTHELEAGLS